MLDVLLDTCCLIWAASDPKQRTPKVVDVLQAEDTAVGVSAISCAELACLADRQRIVLDRIIAATARLKHLTILTADQKILRYPHVETMW